MNDLLRKIKTNIYNNCGFTLSNLTLESESKEYHACRFELNGFKVICRNAKVTPKKVGQFVTFWKRTNNGPIEPLHETDLFDFYVVNVQVENQFGQFVFPKEVLIKKGIVSTDKKEGKRAFRVYPSWDNTTSKQAEQSQRWQLNYFYELNKTTDLKSVIELYKAN